MTASDLPCDSEPTPDREGDAYQALFRAVQDYGRCPRHRDGSAISILHWAVQLNVERHGEKVAAGVCLSALGGDL